MSDQEQGQEIDPSRLISDRIAVTGSVRRARVNAHIPKRRRGRGSNVNDGEGGSQATQPNVFKTGSEIKLVRPSVHGLIYK